MAYITKKQADFAAQEAKKEEKRQLWLDANADKMDKKKYARESAASARRKKDHDGEVKRWEKQRAREESRTKKKEAQAKKDTAEKEKTDNEELARIDEAIKKEEEHEAAIKRTADLGKSIVDSLKERGKGLAEVNALGGTWMSMSLVLAKDMKNMSAFDKKKHMSLVNSLPIMESIYEQHANIGTEEFQSFNLTKQIANAKNLASKAADANELNRYKATVKNLQAAQAENDKNLLIHKKTVAVTKQLAKPFEKLDEIVRKLPMGGLLADFIGIDKLGEKMSKGFVTKMKEWGGNITGFIGNKSKDAETPKEGEQTESDDKSKEAGDKQKELEKKEGYPAGYDMGKQYTEGYEDGKSGAVDKTKEVTEKAEDSLVKGEDIGDEGGDKAGKGWIKKMGKHFKSGGKMLAKILGIGFLSGIVLVIASIAKAFVGVVKGAVQMQKELGVGFGHAVNLGMATREAAAGGFMYGESLEDTSARASSLVEEWGVVNRETIKSVQIVTDLERNYGIAASSAASIAELMEATSSSTKDVLLANMGAEMESLQELGIPVGKVMEEVASDTDFFATHMRMGGKNIIQVAGFAKKLGMSMSTISGAAESLLDFESSVAATMEASMMLGRQINTDRARQLAMAGDFVGMQKEIIKQVGSEAQFNRMNFLQRKKLAAAFGLSVTDLAGMVSAQEKLNRMGPAQTKEMEDAQAASESMQKTWGAIVGVFRTAYSKFVAPMVKKLLEMFGISMDLSSGFEMSKGILQTIRDVVFPLVEGLADGVFTIVKGIKEWWDPNFKKVKELVIAIAGFIGGMVQKLAENKEIAVALVGVWALNKLGILAWVAKSVIQLGVLAASFVTTTIAKNALDAPTGGGGLMGLAAGLTAMGTGTVAIGSLNLGLFGIAAIPALLGIPFLLFMAFGGGAAGMGLIGLASGLTAMGTGTVAKGALVLGLLGITLGIFAYALTFFTGIDFEQVLKGGIALAGFAIAVGIMGIPPIPAAIGLGALALLGLSLALMVFVPAIKLFTGIDFEQVSKGVLAIISLGLAFSALGLMIPFIFLGAIALTLISVAMVPFAIALMIMSAAMAAITPNLETFTPSFERLGAIGGGALLGTAAGIAAIGGALLLFGGGSLLGGIASGIGKFFGGDPVRKFERFAAMAPGLKMAAIAMKDLSKGMRDVNKLVGPTFQLALAFNSLADSANRVSKATMGSLAVGVINTVSGAIQGTITNVGRLIGVVERERVNVEAPVINMDMTKTNKKLDSVVDEIIEMRTVLRGAITKLSQQ